MPAEPLDERLRPLTKTWLVTGSSKGLGRAIVEKALIEGDKVLATARNLHTLDDLASAFPDTLSTFSLDVTKPEQADAAVDAALTAFGRLDVLVNNAGYGLIAPFEQTDAASFRDQIETNLFGVVNTTRAALPIMRAQRGGHIINISSVGGRAGAPGLSAYQAAKWAVSGFTESVSQELAPFDVRMISVEPGGMRTDWGATAQVQTSELLPEYLPSVGAFLNLMTKFVGNEVGDPSKIAKVVFDLTRKEHLPMHLVLGSDALHVLANSEAARQKAAEEWEDVSRSTDFDHRDISYLKGSRFDQT
ncbi:SDR family NAD(P)-dependent oxidoreductase [Sphingomonas sp. S2-65]|uniref:SDR family NAD(P)-dependent oxidoreductase n=1 Tax=Sphingomonas sp. S2-65 TaxID=2903960 RepID=UPI0021BCA7B6|nr:SDR family NAD(P)-dependent oxidoreductase [Sphingomonas sp. S2-65]UYY58105.1 SDR family NAD(P)-dependent oxidoreductase [Sphingomonas sp. S2-65]